MCGLAGIFRKDKITQSDIDLIKQINSIQQHRGPDDEGVFCDNSCVLGHRRLSIIDLSRDGHQPFVSDDGRLQLIFNGEIYNYIELRQELESLGWHFRTKTDTEVLLKAYQHYGENCLSKFNGMFAFAVYDSLHQNIFLARDRVGIKPLYYSIVDSTLYFASEIKALHAVSSLKLSINYQSLFDFLVFNRTDVFDETFNNEIKRIPKGYHAIYGEDGLVLTQWWNPENYVNSQTELTDRNIKEKIQEILVSAVKLRMRSDVPVGSCLSGGLDSSILIGILFSHAAAAEGYPTFTASFPEHRIDETGYIDMLNKKYPFNNIRTFPTAMQAYEKLRDFVYANDEPTTSYSFFSQYEVMKLAKENGVTVLLDGQGGDECFAGYQYFHGFNFYGLFRNKKWMRLGNELLKSIIRKQDKSAYQTFMFQALPDSLRKIVLLRTIPYMKPDFFYEYIETSLIYNNFFNADDLNQSLVRHFQYKLEHLLRMEDRNSMAFSIEARLPYLDYRLIEYVLSISGDLKIKNGETKYLQKISLGEYTTQEILNRKDKIGFGTPGEEWMLCPEWENIAHEYYVHLTHTLPDIFKKNSPLPGNGLERWKVNQLGVWLNIFMC